MRDLGTLSGSGSSNGARINASGQVVGQAVALPDPFFPLNHAFSYTETGGIQDLGTLPGVRATSSALGVNADGDVVGYSVDNGLVMSRAFLRPARGATRDLGTLGGRNSQANDINDNGTIVGIATLASGQQHAFVYGPASGMQDVNDLIDPASGWTLFTAQAVNNRGAIVGIGTMGGRSRGYRARRVRDDTPPEIDVTVSPSPNANGWSTGPVIVRWTVRDPETGVVSATGCDAQTLAADTAATTLTCESANGLGRVSARSVTVRIDATPPVVGCTAAPAIVWPPNGRMVPVAVDVSVSDPTSGANGFTLESIAVSDGSPVVGVVSGFSVGEASTSGSVQAARTASSRVYSLTYAGRNGAGVTASCTATITVPHDRSE